MVYGLIVYKNTDNIGDDILSYAAEQYLPHVNYIIDRENMDVFCPDKGEIVSCIMNGWYLHNKQHWPPSHYLNLLPIGIHLASNDNWGNGFEYLKGYGKKCFEGLKEIGCRDTSTLNQLRSIGIDGFFSGCLTLTIKKFERLESGESIYAVDIPDWAVQLIEKQSERKIEKLTHLVDNYGELTWEERKENVETILKKYQGASCVVTTRLHVALPCLALETPVLLLQDDKEKDRFEDYLPLLHYCNMDEFRKGDYPYDFNHPPVNKPDFYILRDKIKALCEEFIHNTSLLDEKFTFSYEREKEENNYRDYSRSICEQAENQSIRETEELRRWTVKQQEDNLWLQQQIEQQKEKINDQEKMIKELKEWCQERENAVHYLETQLNEREKEYQEITNVGRN